MNSSISSRDAIKLYREIIRASRHFYWKNHDGIPWSDVIKRSARKEFEAARYERDPIMISRMIVVGYDCVEKTKQKVVALKPFLMFLLYILNIYIYLLVSGGTSKRPTHAK